MIQARCSCRGCAVCGGEVSCPPPSTYAGACAGLCLLDSKRFFLSILFFCLLRSNPHIQAILEFSKVRCCVEQVVSVGAHTCVSLLADW